MGKDVEPGDTAVTRAWSSEYSTTVTDDKTWSVDVKGDDILHADKDHVQLRCGARSDSNN